MRTSSDIAVAVSTILLQRPGYDDLYTTHTFQAWTTYYYYYY